MVNITVQADIVIGTFLHMHSYTCMHECSRYRSINSAPLMIPTSPLYRYRGQSWRALFRDLSAAGSVWHPAGDC